MTFTRTYRRTSTRRTGFRRGLQPIASAWRGMGRAKHRAPLRCHRRGDASNRGSLSQLWCKRVSVVRNSVRLDEFIEPTATTKRRRQAVYVGRASFDRGLVEMVEACAAVELPLVLAGSIGSEEADWLKKSSADVLS